LIPAIEAHQAKLGRPPRLVAADAAFYSAKNDGRQRRWAVKRCAFQSLQQKPRAQTRAEEALVPQWAKMAEPDARGASAWSSGDTVSDRCRYKGFDE